MGTYIELLSNFIQVFLLIHFITKAFGFKKDVSVSKIVFVITWIVVFLELSFINHIVIYDGFLSGIAILTLIIYARLFLKGKVFQQTFVTIFAMAIIFTIASAVIFLFSYILKIKTELLISDFTTYRIIILIACRSTEWFVFSFILKINSEYSLSLKEWFLFMSMPFLTWVAVTLMTESSLQMQYIQSEMFYMTLIMILINIIVFFFMYKIKKDTKIQIEYELLKMQYNNIKQMESNMKALSENTYSIRHDLKKHLLAIKTLSENGKCEEINKYIENLIDKSFDEVQKIIFTDNDIFNAIINTKLELCKQKGILTEIIVSNEAVLNIKTEDIAVLFGNIFDNAIEASEKTKNKVILLNIQVQGEYVSIYMENSFDNKYSDINLKTTKENKDKHGFGIKNVKKIVEENEGMIQYFINDSGMFCCDILYKKC